MCATIIATFKKKKKKHLKILMSKNLAEVESHLYCRFLSDY